MVEIAREDISAVIRLVREVCDRWDDPAAWRAHLLHGACALLNGNVGTIVAEYDGDRENGVFGRLDVVAAVGVPDEMRHALQPAISSFDARSFEDVSNSLLPGISNLYGEILRQGWVTAARSSFTDAASYQAGEHYETFRSKMDVDDYVVSVRLVDEPRRPEAINVNRPRGAPPFEPRDVALLKLLHDEIAPLIGVRLATEQHLCRDGLSRRLREALALLLDGRSEKEVAATMQIAVRTTHQYVTMLYEHFHVSSRAELLAYFVRRAPIPRINANGGVDKPGNGQVTPAT